MTLRPLDVSWLCDEYAGECYSFIYVRAAPEQVIARLGGQWENFTPGPFPGDPDEYPRPGDPLGVTAIGDWTFVFDSYWLVIDENLIAELSRGTRLVSQAALSLKGLDYFYWCEDGEIRFCHGADVNDPTGTPDELVETMAEIDRLYPSFPDLYKGPAFLLVEHLTGIRLTEELLKGCTFRWGAIPRT
ncbi:DUF6461 domain-containing protein [Nonomuraea sp. NPDC049725]|uniref:DUF6461 domain-containing protein n=1 Tax=Nonomuraea sp. NPDC049725 TaxID=3154508 RepID=UPI003435EFF7